MALACRISFAVNSANGTKEMFQTRGIEIIARTGAYANTLACKRIEKAVLRKVDLRNNATRKVASKGSAMRQAASTKVVLRKGAVRETASVARPERFFLYLEFCWFG